MFFLKIFMNCRLCTPSRSPDDHSHPASWVRMHCCPKPHKKQILAPTGIRTQDLQLLIRLGVQGLNRHTFSGSFFRPLLSIHCRRVNHYTTRAVHFMRYYLIYLIDAQIEPSPRPCLPESQLCKQQHGSRLELGLPRSFLRKRTKKKMDFAQAGIRTQALQQPKSGL